jgi:hypothetical protein
MFSVSKNMSLNRVACLGKIGNPQKLGWVMKSVIESQGAARVSALFNVAIASTRA